MTQKYFIMIIYMSQTQTSQRSEDISTESLQSAMHSLYLIYTLKRAWNYHQLSIGY